MAKKSQPKVQPSSRWRTGLLSLLLVASLAMGFIFNDQIIGFIGAVGNGLLTLWQWVVSLGQLLLDTFGLGLAVIALVILGVLAFKGWLALLRRWHRWMGLVVLSLSMFGLLSFLDTPWPWLRQGVGGALGQLITGGSLGMGAVRVALLSYLGLLLLSPDTTRSWTRALLRGMGRAVLVAGKGAKALGMASGRGAVAGLAYLGRGVSALFRALTSTMRTTVRREQWPQTPAQGSEAAPGAPPTTPRPTAPKSSKAERLPYTPPQEETQPAEGKPIPETPLITPSGWELPTTAVLDPAASATFGPADMERRAETLQKALAEYSVEARVSAWNVGPTVTQFEVEPGWDVKYREVKEKGSDGIVRTSRQEVSRTRVKVDRITALSNDLALALAAPSIRIEAPVPGKSIVGIEVPNSSLGVVPLRSVIESQQFQRLKNRTKLAMALGKGVGGESVVADLTKMPHLLIAGATGSGKSVCINSLICCLAMHNTPEELKLVLIDPKRVEFTSFNTLPHLVMRVIVDREKAVEALHWLAKEMDERYKTLANAGARNIEDYNRTQRPGWPLPYMVLFIDELADLMTVAFEETEKNLCRLAQLSRATGIHLVVATQRPSVDVVTGLIKANFPTRMSFALSSQVDSRTILDTAGADKLLGRGDMLYLATDAPRPRRLQGCFVSDPEIERLVSFWRRQRAVMTPAQPTSTGPSRAEGAASEEPKAPADPLLEAARRLAREHQHISVSFLQRRLQIGSSKATKLMELLDEEGAITGEEKA